jgi:ABC-type lipoprotein export system ATPase subunit
VSLLRLRSVAKSYTRGNRATAILRDASLIVEPGSLVTVYGGRGSGKTTLLKVAAGVESPDFGVVAIAERRLDALSKRQLLELRRETLGWVDRDGPHDSRLTMATYVALPLYREVGSRPARVRALDALAALGARHYADARWGDLSNDQRVLCAIAHATVRKPRLLVADDPTAGLGLLDRERVCQVLRTAADDGLGVLVTVPDLSATMRSHETLALVAGRLLSPADGTPNDRGGNVVRMPLRRSA